ncbi:MAG: hypothetical protein ACR2MY_01800 [Candidatus Dormibacteria bacterium]
MSEAPLPVQGTGPESEVRAGGVAALLYGLYGAMMADFGCIIGAAGFVLLVVLSAVFAANITPCTSAGGIPCAH